MWVNFAGCVFFEKYLKNCLGFVYIVPFQAFQVLWTFFLSLVGNDINTLDRVSLVNCNVLSFDHAYLASCLFYYPKIIKYFSQRKKKAFFTEKTSIQKTCTGLA